MQQHPEYRRTTEEATIYMREWRAANPEKNRATDRKHRDKNPQAARDKLRAWQNKVRVEMIQAYGGRCACCGVSEAPFLAIDHIDGVRPEGAPKGGHQLYAWLRRNEWPEGFQILCHNCNMAVRFDRTCPHKYQQFRVV